MISKDINLKLLYILLLNLLLDIDCISVDISLGISFTAEDKKHYYL
jgi:hypothetical protein